MSEKREPSVNNHTPINQTDRNLSDVFKELQEIRYSQTNQVHHSTSSKNKSKSKILFHAENNRFYTKKTINLSNIVICFIVLLLIIIAIFPKNVFSVETELATDNSEETIETASIPANVELNRQAFNMQKIIAENSNFEKVKEQVSEEREIEYETQTQSSSTLPRGEQIIQQQGIPGKENVSLVKTYENGDFVEETILARETLVEPTPKLISRGTSEFLAKHQVHIGDTMYFVKDGVLKSDPSNEETSTDVADVKASIDVKLLELPSEEWAKVSFDGIEGYVETSNLTSPTTTPNIVEKNRVQRILLKVNIGMELNKSSGLTLKDYEKIFTNIPNDQNKIFQDNYQVFYNMEKKYNINGIFLASIAIHESGWGTSNIAKDKNNLFGYGAYDETPYESSLDFDSYADGIETVAKSLVKYYLNPAGTKIYDGETASGWYYNGPTVEGVNTRYASDENWHTKVYSYMEMLYKRLET